jgi:hypothetical protein
VLASRNAEVPLAVFAESVDVVVPFRGAASALPELVERLGEIAAAGAASVTLVDNRPAGHPLTDRVHPGSFPPRRRLRWPLLAAWSAAAPVRALAHLLTGRRRAAVLDLTGPIGTWALEAGRLTSNDAD